MPTGGYDIDIDELDETSEVAHQPPRARIALKRHQLTLLSRCRAYERENIQLSTVRGLQTVQQWQPDDYLRTRVGIIGDRAGSGKSYVVLSLMLDDRDDEIIRGHENTIKSYGCNKVILCTRDAVRPVKTSLLVIPHNMCAQWDMYVKTFIDNESFKYVMIKDTRAVQNMLNSNVNSYDLIVCTCTCYNRLADIMTSKSIKFSRVVFDEVDNVNLPSCMPIDASFTWFVTASFGNLLYPRGYSGWDTTINKYVWCATGLRNSGFIKTLFMDLNRSVAMDYVKVLVVKNKDEFVLSSIDLPPVRPHMVLSRTPVSISLLHGVVDNQIIESLNAGDVQSALQHVAATNRNTEENIVKVILEKFQRQFNSLESRLNLATHAPVDTYESEAERVNEIARLQRKLSEVASKMASIRERITNSDMCCICFDDISHKTVTTCCSNAYCFRCINLWLARRSVCPLCKTSLRLQDLLVVQENQAALPGAQEDTPTSDQDLILSLSDDPHERHDKIKNLELILARRQNESGQYAKILIFASFENTFYQIVTVLDRLGMRYAYLKGNNEVVKNIVNNYKDGSLSVLLVNTRNYGSGLNLENTTDIVMFHKLDTEIEKQVIGRANRMGRTTPLNVWYLLYENELNRATRLTGTVADAAAPSTSS